MLIRYLRETTSLPLNTFSLPRDFAIRGFVSFRVTVSQVFTSRSKKFDTFSFAVSLFCERLLLVIGKPLVFAFSLFCHQFELTLFSIWTAKNDADTPLWPEIVVEVSKLPQVRSVDSVAAGLQDLITWFYSFGLGIASLINKRNKATLSNDLHGPTIIDFKGEKRRYEIRVRIV